MDVRSGGNGLHRCRAPADLQLAEPGGLDPKMCCVAEMGGLKPESDPKESFAFEGANVGYEVNRPLERFGRDVKG